MEIITQNWELGNRSTAQSDLVEAIDQFVRSLGVGLSVGVLYLGLCLVPAMANLLPDGIAALANRRARFEAATAV
jgi:hypothetical protein